MHPLFFSPIFGVFRVRGKGFFVVVYFKKNFNIWILSLWFAWLLNYHTLISCSILSYIIIIYMEILVYIRNFSRAINANNYNLIPGTFQKYSYGETNGTRHVLHPLLELKENMYAAGLCSCSLFTWVPWANLDGCDASLHKPPKQ